MLHIKFHILTHAQAIFSVINHQNKDLLSATISWAFIVLKILTNTVDILTAKQIIAGEKIIPIKFFTSKYSNILPFLNTLSPKLNAFTKIIAGDNIIAIRITPILIRNTTSIAINGIATAIVWQKDNNVFNNDV
ncbi:hypothetical protein IJL65_00725 [bacterium]|nr:hypothetical protein [bacterium]